MSVLLKNKFQLLLCVLLGVMSTFKVFFPNTGTSVNDSPYSDDAKRSSKIKLDPELDYNSGYFPSESDWVLEREDYIDKVSGFWLAQSIANWTGLVTELDKVEPPFYTDEDWQSPDQVAIWGDYVPHASTIDFYFVRHGEPWGADDDTDIEYMYQHLLDIHNTSVLTGEQIREGWLHHIYSNEDAPLYKKFPYSQPSKENFLWESNDRARELMASGLVPPQTSEPVNNNKYMMIDAQLTTEIFGLFAPCRPDVALEMAYLPIRTTAKDEAQWIAEFYVIMHSLAACVDKNLSPKDQVQWLASEARKRLPENSYPAQMFDFVKAAYHSNPDKDNWEQTRDEVYERFQMGQTEEYKYQSPFEAGINFAASLVSLFYGEGDLPRTVRIASLVGWDADNPAATWGGLLGYILGAEKVKEAFGQTDLSDTFWIHRTRRNFVDHTAKAEGEDTFKMMAERAMYIVDRVILEEIHGGISLSEGQWFLILSLNVRSLSVI